ncbi:MAG: SdrD B-like domain-containing protein, partial [Bacteroidota bacterium]
ATDACGNETTATQIITVADTGSPTIANVPADVTVECSGIPAIDPNVTAQDDCDADVMLNFSEIIAPGACQDDYTITRTWTATDNCGNTISENQIITVSDTQKPVMAGIPSDLTVDCNNVPAPATPVATDNCDTDVDIDFSEISTPVGCGAIIVRTWTARDNCGNIVEASQTITVQADDPVLSNLPTDLTVECNNIPAPATVTANSDCLGNVSVDFSENIIPGSCENNYTIERTWTAVAGCGTNILHTQTITVEDTQKPIMAGIPANLEVACGAVPTPAQPIATDNCDTDVEIIFSEIQTPLACGYELTRTWTATDNCGNSTEASQIITVQDNEDPILIGVPTDEIVNCGNIPAPATPTANDNCDTDVEIIFAETSVVNGCETIITRTWTATDDCGNETIETQTITVNPDAPTLSATPADLTVECDNVPAVADLTAFDGCSGNAVPLDFTENIIPGSCEHAYIIERTWSVTNACGDISYTQIITVQDTQQPILAGVPTDVTVECDEVPALPTVTATDNCDTDVEVIFSEANTPATCGYLLTRTWTATDACGNEVTATQVITVGDDMPPVMAGIPADITIECNNIPTPANPMAQDNCDNDVTITYSEILTPGDCQDSYLLERTWTATDACGNTTSGVQKITVQDTMDPTLIGIPNDLTVDLTLGQMIPTPPSVIGNDNCDTDVEIFFSENQAGQGCAFTLIRTWTAEDNCGNTAMATQTIEVIGGLSVTETHVDAGCGMGTGSIDLTVTGGLAPFTFTWNNGIGNVEDPTGLMAGIYEVTVTDATGCAANLTIEILGTSNIQLNISSTMVSCFGGNDGTIDLTVNGGTAPFTYNWDNGIGNIEDPTGVSAGSYNITVTDANGCTASNGVNVNQPTELGVIIYPTNVSCSGTLGSATANVTGGTMPYQYNWSNGQTTSTINNLVAGTYTLTITDAKGCTLEVFTTIVELQGLVITFDSEDVTCNGETDGSATANVSAGLPPYTYAWSNGATTAIVDNLTAGTYTVSVADNMGCLGEATVTITEPDALTLDVAATGGACNGGLGMAMANVTGGTAPYTYSWDNAVTSTTATIENLAPGTYNVTVTDANGCVTSGNTTITEDLGLGVMIDKMDVNCYLGNDGMATVAVMGGTPTFTYAWSNGETNPILSNLEAGTYTVTVTDMTGCTGTASVEIISPPQIILDVTATEVTIAGNDGTATATAIGGTIPYTYVWSNGQMTATATGLIAGTYSVTVIDANGCFAVDQVDVDNGMPLGDISIGDYVWFDADRDGIQDANEMGYNNVEVRLIVAGTDGVFGTPDDMIVATEITGNHPITGTSGYYLFENVAPSQYQIEFFLGSIPNDYQFSLPNQGNDDNLDSDADPNTGRTPIFTVTANQSNDFNLDAGLHPECDNVTNGGSIMSSQMICAGEVPDLLVNDVLPSGGSGDLEYIWLSNTTGSPFSSTNPEWTVIQGSTNEFYQPGNIYLNTFFIRCVRRAGCTNYLGESNIVSIIVTPLPTTQITQAPTTLCQSETATFEAAFAGFDATYTWDFGADANPQTANERTVNSVGYTFGGSKTVTLTVEKNGCAVTTQYTLEVTNCFNGFEFTSFKPEKAVNGTDVDITWSTKYEMDNSRFFLEYSKTGDTFRAFSMKVANGSADEENDYTSKHEDPYYGVNYYRVKYVAPSGKEVYSKVETVVFDNGSSDIKVFPNPVKKATYVEILTELQQDATIEVVDLQGKVYQTQIVSEGFRTYKVDMTDYPAGTYLIWVRYNKWRKDVERVVKVTE